MIPCISQVCSLGSDFATDLTDFSAAGFQVMEIWLTKLENFVRDHDVGRVLAMRDKYRINLPVASVQGGVLGGDDEPRRAARELFTRRLALLAQVQVPTLVIAADLPHPLEATAVQGAIRNLHELATMSGDQGIRLALEFQAGSAFINNLQTAVAVVEQVGSPWLGICLDAFHFQTGPSKDRDLGLLTSDTLFHVQICDVADRPREFAGDADRILPGDGDFDFPGLFAQLRSIGYEGPVSLEVMNPQFAQAGADQMGFLAQEVFKALLPR